MFVFLFSIFKRIYFLFLKNTKNILNLFFFLFLKYPCLFYFCLATVGSEKVAPNLSNEMRVVGSSR